MKNVAIIMAGGIGKRLYPISTSLQPKQFLKLLNNKYSMLQSTINRINTFIEKENILIVTNIEYKDLVFSQIPNFPRENVIFEPYTKNTAPCIALASMYIKKRYADANVIVLPVDHFIPDTSSFLKDIQLAFANLDNHKIFAIGITPTRIETQYGYLELESNQHIFKKVIRFKEKPNFSTAKQYIQNKNFFWNSGIYIWKNSYLLKQLKEKGFPLFSDLEKLYPLIDTSTFDSCLKEIYHDILPISIDYALLEKEENLYAKIASFDWDDIGSQEALHRISAKKGESKNEKTFS